MSERNRALSLRWFEEVWNQRLTATVDELLAPGGIGYMEGAVVRGPAEFKAVRAALLEAFPDLRVTVEDTVVEGDNVVVRWSASGTHLGDGLGLQATRSPVAFRGMTWQRFANGRMVEGWDAWNQGALIETLKTAVKAQSTDD
jgi:predicted ester cyclase